MKETARYCEPCVATLTPTETDPKKKEFFEAKLESPLEGSTPDFEMQMEQQGTCENCGKRSNVNYYFI